MFKVTNVCWIVIFGSFSGMVLCSGTRIKEDMTIVRICNTTDPVNIDVFNDYIMHHDFENVKSHSKELSCFLLCIYSEHKWMDRHGNFRTTNIKSWLRRSNLDIKDQELLFEKCIIKAELSDPCTSARYFTECFWKNHQGTGSLDDDNHTLHAIIRKKDVM